jgi:hypothetical protein
MAALHRAGHAPLGQVGQLRVVADARLAAWVVGHHLGDAVGERTGQQGRVSLAGDD